MTEGTPPTPEEFRQLNRDLMERVIDRAASDPGWKQRLLDDPEAAMAEADFPEARGLREMQAAIVGTQEEAEGQGMLSNFCNYGPPPPDLNEWLYNNFTIRTP